MVAVTKAGGGSSLFNASFTKSVREFDALRPEGVAKSDKCINSVLADLSILMGTMGTNHLWTNLVPRLKRYFSWRYLHLRKDHRAIISAVVNRPKAALSQFKMHHVESSQLVAELRSLMPLPSAAQFKSRAHLTLKLYARILRDTEAVKLDETANSRQRRRARLFTLLPLKNGYTVAHVPISKMTLVSLLKKHHISDIKGDGRDEDHRVHWQRHFNLNAFETRTRKFAGQAATDGVSISMLIDRPASFSGPCLQEDAPRLGSLAPNTAVVAVDPGFTDIVTTARAVVKVDSAGAKTLVGAKEDGAPTHASYSSAMYYSVAKIDHSRHQIDRWNRDTADAVERVPSPCTVDAARADAFVQAYLRELPGLLRHRAEKGYRGLRFTRYVHRQKAINKISQMVAPCGTHTVVAFGDWKGGYKSPVSRRCAGPLQDIKRHLAQRSDVTLVGVDEFRTSQTCSCCWGRLTNMRAKSQRRRRDGEKYEAFGRIHKVLHCKNSDGISACRGVRGRRSRPRDVEPGRECFEEHPRAGAVRDAGTRATCALSARRGSVPGTDAYGPRLHKRSLRGGRRPIPGRASQEAPRMQGRYPGQ